jgi:Glycosyl transferases group 1/Glycosyl transferase 4-like domain
MKLLFATSLLPENEATSGYEIANRALLHGLRALGHQVVPIGFCNPWKSAFVAEGSVNLGDLSVTNADVDIRQKLVWLKRAIQNSTTFAGAKLQIITQDVFAQIIAHEGEFDGVIINGAPMAAAFEKLLTSKPFIFIAHNVEWQTAASNAQTATSFFERTLFAREARILKALEKRVASRAEHVFTLSVEDADAFKTLGAKSASAVPLIVGLKAQRPVTRIPKWHAGLIGTWSWAPNRVGLDWFLNEVTPHLPDDFKFAVAGKLAGNPSINHPGATILGRVPSALDFTRDCACLPLVSRAGTGVQLKTLEAFELGLPTVATSSSVRGIAGIPANCAIEDDPEQFAKALVEAACKGPSADTDGELFHANQLAHMQDALSRGISTFTRQPFLQAAE